MASDLLHTIEAIGREKGLEPDVIIQAIEEAYAAASRKYYQSKEEFSAKFDPSDGSFLIFSHQTIVEDDDVADPLTEIALGDARKVRADAELGEVIETRREGLDAPLERSIPFHDEGQGRQDGDQQDDEDDRHLHANAFGDHLSGDGPDSTHGARPECLRCPRGNR